MCRQEKLTIDEWAEETVSSRKKWKDRLISSILNKLARRDLLISSELSRLGRNLMEVMSILNTCMRRDVKIHTIKDQYELRDNINSNVLAFAFSLFAEI